MLIAICNQNYFQQDSILFYLAWDCLSKTSVIPIVRVSQQANDILFSISPSVFISQKISLHGNLDLRKTAILRSMVKRSLLMWVQNRIDDFGLLTATRVIHLHHEDHTFSWEYFLSAYTKRKTRSKPPPSRQPACIRKAGRLLFL